MTDKKTQNDSRVGAVPTDPKELERQIMSECIAKNEREWWAK